METMKYYLLTQISFAVLTAICLIAIYVGLQKALLFSPMGAEKIKQILRWYVVGILVWIGLLTVLSVSGFLQNFSTTPPRFFIVVLIPMIALVWIAFSKNTTEILQYVPSQWLLYIQSFRFFVEILLWLLFLDHLVPEQMTFEGRNLDMITGILAPIAGLLMVKLTKYKEVVAILFNIVGLALLINIVSVSILSAPTPFRMFMDEPANTIVTHFPIVFLPGILVPIAFYMHFFSLKQLLMKSEANEKETNLHLANNKHS